MSKGYARGVTGITIALCGFALDGHIAALREALTLLDEVTTPNTIRASVYRWRQTRERVGW